MRIDPAISRRGLTGVVLLAVAASWTLSLFTVTPPAEGRVLRGAVRGAIVGRAIGGKKGARAGAVVGGVAGAARSAAAREAHHQAQRQQEAWEQQRLEAERLQLEQQRLEVEQERLRFEQQRPVAPPSSAAPALAGAELIREIQRSLIVLRYQPGAVDGVLSPSTASAIRAYQTATGLLATGQPSAELLAHLRQNGG